LQGKVRASVPGSVLFAALVFFRLFLRPLPAGTGGPTVFYHMAQPNNPLHGITLLMMLEHLLQQYGWAGLSRHIDINCFKNNPSIKSSLTFLRKTPWARQKVEELYLDSLSDDPSPFVWQAPPEK
jgi:hypothetical protein